ncbi:MULTISPECIES: hypothetical protein [Salipaludibacillus]|uniref:hypothetical protein n=1 Tax=Salipaludibacillus TaxID=1884449 RepID=UPI001601997B|nr:hypothetical protein [Salipaludibacillus neizhouensis]
MENIELSLYTDEEVYWAIYQYEQNRKQTKYKLVRNRNERLYKNATRTSICT